MIPLTVKGLSCNCCEMVERSKRVTIICKGASNSYRAWDGGESSGLVVGQKQCAVLGWEIEGKKRSWAQRGTAGVLLCVHTR